MRGTSGEEHDHGHDSERRLRKRQPAEQLYQEQLVAQRIRLDRMFAKLMVVQWVFAIAIALIYSPYGWEGKQKVVHAHVYLALCSWARA